MTDEQILQMVKEHFEEDWDESDGWEYSGNFDDFVKFAQQIFEMGRESASVEEEFKDGYDEG